MGRLMSDQGWHRETRGGPFVSSTDSDSEIPKALAASEVNFHQGGEEKT